MMRNIARLIVLVALGLAVCGAARAAGEAKVAPAAPGANADLEFIDTSFENASPLWYEFTPEGVIVVNLVYDLERSSPNRAAGHFHFMLQGRPGAHLTIEFKNLDNVWNGKPGSVAKELKAVAVSQDGKTWTPMATESLPENRVQLKVTLPGPRLYVARLEPYRISDLEKMLGAIRPNPLVKIETIGKTVEGLDLEIVRIGDPKAPYRLFVRARAHPWESGGNWVVEGLVGRLLRGDAAAKKFLASYCVWILPMANKDGVARGKTRFNSQGKDLNRDWGKPADPALAPENAALERWLSEMIGAGLKPHLALEMHNDGGGLLHVGRPEGSDAARYLERMATFETLLRKHTWFTEGSTKPTFTNPGSLGEGWQARFGIDAAVHELNCNWIAGLKDYPSAKNWKAYGESLADVFYEYFETVKP